MDCKLSRSETAGLYNKYIFNFIRNCQTMFQSSLTILHSHQQWMRVRFFHILPTLGTISLFKFSHSSDCILVSHGFNSHFLDNYNVKYLFKCLLPIHIYSFVICPVKCCAYILLDYLSSYHWAVRVLYIFWIKVLYNRCVLQLSSPSYGGIYMVLTVL